MNEGERHRHILGFLRDRPFATVRDLSQIVVASPATIRRDIGKLHEMGAVRKVFGGIAAADNGSGPERLSARPFEENQMLGVEAKKAIAEEAEKLVSDGDALIIHGGSTCYLFALRLARRNVKIYTNSMPLAATLWQNGTCHLTIAGGELHRGPGILYSPEMELPEFYASKFFIGAQGVGPAGVMESHPLLVREMERLLGRADEVVVLADSRKFGVRARYSVVSFSRIATLITDDGLSDSDDRMLTDAGIKVIIARTPKSGDKQ
ncbi:DeoR/GlpR family DNA-binding transcription regulator [Dongia deserti]|uniref:DeoR/GlpR family DNA-binding transcription regulator n=1 Tax=Dongia deserti TaxID=2268030 RepID=UPI000E64BEB8|nr:DeoR/GlpR family DNA-binding transcription regulator [Dongia deserti]